MDLLGRIHFETACRPVGDVGHWMDAAGDVAAATEKAADFNPSVCTHFAVECGNQHARQLQDCRSGFTARQGRHPGRNCAQG